MSGSEAMYPISISNVLQVLYHCVIVILCLAFDRQYQKESMARKKSKYDEPIGEVDIRGIQYNIFLYPKSVYCGRHPDSEAHMTTSPPELHFCEEYCTLETIRHEVFHCFIRSCFTQAMGDLSTDDLEEVACEVFAYFGVKMLIVSQDIEELINDTGRGINEPK